MRVLRIAPAHQPDLFTGQAGQWAGLPERARAEVLALLARIIARGVLAGDGQAAVPAAGKERRGD